LPDLSKKSAEGDRQVLLLVHIMRHIWSFTYRPCLQSHSPLSHY